MEKEIITALIAATSALVVAIIGFIVTYITINKQVSQSVKALSASHRAEIIRRQLDAVESIWGIFDATSRTGGKGRIIQLKQGGVYISLANTKAFINLIEKTFNGKSGLYISKSCRRKLFDFRDYLISLTKNTPAGVPLSLLSPQQFDEFYARRMELRLKIREEIGALDLNMTKEELNKLTT